MLSNKSFTDKFSWAILLLEIAILLLTLALSFSKMPTGILEKDKANTFC